jgi:O-succinylbenzoate synthase
MALQISYHPHPLKFRFEAGTSRGTLTEKTSWILKVTDPEQPDCTGWGECGPLKGLSIDDLPDFEDRLASICRLFNQLDLEVFPFNLPIILDQVIPQELPSIRFGIEMALHEFMNGGQHALFDNPFTKGLKSIPINGLIWMGSFDFMQQQIEDKLAAGFSTIKIKVGAIDFEQECNILESIRNRFSPSQITLRVDANGAFREGDVFEKLNRLSEYDLHSIEQPIRQGQIELMTKVAAVSPVPIALDEELIGITSYKEKFNLLKQINPPYIILKPTLLGGFRHCDEWIEIANRLEIGWWITSALESNIGLNAIAQYTAQFNNALPQGLGTGQLYHNNFESPLTIKNGALWFDSSQGWDPQLTL